MVVGQQRAPLVNKNCGDDECERLPSGDGHPQRYIGFAQSDRIGEQRTPIASMMASRRPAARTWCGLKPPYPRNRREWSHSPSRARAAQRVTTAGGAILPGRSKRASGSRGGARCSARIRGQLCERPLIRAIELIDVGDGIVVDRAVPAPFGQLRPGG